MGQGVSSYREQGFQVELLENEKVRLAMVPELGGRVVSMFDKQSRREWLDGWEPASERRLWHPTDLSSFETGPGAGLDECLPTVLPCRVQGRDLADHGELWCRTPEFARSVHALTCEWSLASLPLAFRRTIHLAEDGFVFSYRLENLVASPTPFQWAWHALLKLEEGDELHLEPELTTCCSPDGTRFPWPQALPGQNLARAEVGSADPPAAKVFLGPLKEGAATVQGRASALHLSWPAEFFPWAGLWITRGAWKGLHHWAIEPTNGPRDHLSELVEEPLAWLAGQEVREWDLRIRLQPESARDPA